MLYLHALFSGPSVSLRTAVEIFVTGSCDFPELFGNRKPACMCRIPFPLIFESSVVSCVVSEHPEPGAAPAKGTVLSFPLGISPTAVIAAQIISRILLPQAVQ